MKWELHTGSQSSKPLEQEKTDTAVFLRRNIKQIDQKNEDGSSAKVWQYEEIKLTPDEYAEMQSIVYQDLANRMDTLDSTLAEILLGQAEGSLSE